MSRKIGQLFSYIDIPSVQFDQIILSSLSFLSFLSLTPYPSDAGSQQGSAT